MLPQNRRSPLVHVGAQPCLVPLGRALCHLPLPPARPPKRADGPESSAGARGPRRESGMCPVDHYTMGVWTWTPPPNPHSGRGLQPPNTGLTLWPQTRKEGVGGVRKSGLDPPPLPRKFPFL